MNLRKPIKKLQDSFVKTPVENKDTKKDEVVVSKTEENKIDLKILCHQLEESREYCKEQFLHLYITKKRYADGYKGYYYNMSSSRGHKDKYTLVFYWSSEVDGKRDYLEDSDRLKLCNQVSGYNPSGFFEPRSVKNTTLDWLSDDTINKKDFSLLGNLITSEDITDCNNISKISDSLFFVHNTRADELTKHIKDTIEYLKKINQVVKILDKFLGLKYSDSPSYIEAAESCDVIAIKILDDDGRLTKEAIEKADSLKKQLHL